MCVSLCVWLCFAYGSEQRNGKNKTSGSGRLCRCVAYQVQQLRRQKIPIFCRCGRCFVWSWYVCSVLYYCILKAFCVASGRVRCRVVDNSKVRFYLVVVCFVSRVWSFIHIHIYYILYIVVWCVSWSLRGVCCH